MASDQIPENLSAQVQGWFCNSRALIPGFKSDHVMTWTLDEWDHVGPVLPASVWNKLQCLCGINFSVWSGFGVWMPGALQVSF